MRMDALVGIWSQNPTSATYGAVTILNTNRVINDPSNTVVVQFSTNHFQAAFPGSDLFAGLVTMTFAPSIFSAGALPADFAPGGTFGCGTGCTWSLGLLATFYVLSSGNMLNSNVALTAGTRIPSACTLVPHPSMGFTTSFFSNCLPLNPAASKSDNLVLRMGGFINMPSGGVWTFFTHGDDGSRLWIGTSCVVDNNAACCTELSGTFNFGSSGWYEITIELSQGGGGVGINVQWQKSTSPLVAKALIPASVFSPSLTLPSPLVLAFSGGASTISRKSATLFRSCNYGLDLPFVTKDVGAYNGATQMGVPDNAISSLLVPYGMQVKLYENSNFGGGTRTEIDNKNLCANPTTLNDATTSFTVGNNPEGLPNLVASFYHNCNYAGTSDTFAPGFYDGGGGSRGGISDNQLSSLRVPAGLKVTLFDGDDFLLTGQGSQSYTSDAS
jgi:hypothetical protein